MMKIDITPAKDEKLLPLLSVVNSRV